MRWPSRGFFVFNDVLRYETKKRDKMLVLITVNTVDQMSSLSMRLLA